MRGRPNTVEVPAAIGQGITYVERAAATVTLFSTWRPDPVFHRHGDRTQPWHQRRTTCGRQLHVQGHDGWYSLGTSLPLGLVLGGMARPCRRCWP